MVVVVVLVVMVVVAVVNGHEIESEGDEVEGETKLNKFN